MRSVPSCHGCGTSVDLMQAWGQVWCVDCLCVEAKAAAGISDERVWPETAEACNNAPFDWERGEDYIPNHPEPHSVPEGGLICAFDAQALRRHFDA